MGIKHELNENRMPVSRKLPEDQDLRKLLGTIRTKARFTEKHIEAEFEQGKTLFRILYENKEDNIYDTGGTNYNPWSSNLETDSGR